MHGNEHKTIGVLINKIDDYFQKITYQTLQKKAIEYGYNLVVFNSYINPNSEKAYDKMEEKILDFVPFENLDGIIAVPDSYGDLRIQNHLKQVLYQYCKAPVVFIRTIDRNFCSVGTNERTAIRGIIRHFIYDHHFTRISFMGGPPGHPDADNRFQCFLDEMKAANLEIMPNGIFHGDFWCNYCKQAAEYFTSDPDHQPQVIICANDYMAISLCDSLSELGYRIPEDICVSGYDDTKVAKEYDPAISSVSIDFGAMTAKGMEILHNLMNGIEQDQVNYLEPTLKLRASCGCCKNDKVQINHDVNQLELSAKLIDRQIKFNYFSVDMDSSNNLEEMHTSFANNIGGISSNKNFYLCLFGHENEQNEIAFTSDPIEESTLRFAFENNEDKGILNVQFKSKELLPECLKPDGIDLYYVTMLHNSLKYFGYTVATFEKGKSFDIFFHSWNITLGITIDEIYSKIRIRNLMDQIERQSIIDPLTGLYNRRGFEVMVEKQWNETMLANDKAVFIGIDLDRLKYVNDNFGHSEGDYAICLIANAIKEAAEKTGAVSGRMGGDEFAAVIFHGSENEENYFEQVFYHNIQKANLVSGKKYLIDATLGYYITAITPEVHYKDCMCKSDEDLYKKKSVKKLQR